MKRFNLYALACLLLMTVSQGASANQASTDQLTNSTPEVGPVIWTNTLVIETDNGQDCSLSYHVGETLWSIAKRYAELWQVNIYAAILAIYQKNPHAFYHYKINGLLPHKQLHCPSKYLLLSQGDKAEAKAHYQALLSQ